jgi:hypothetical protein
VAFAGPQVGHSFLLVYELTLITTQTGARVRYEMTRGLICSIKTARSDSAAAISFAVSFAVLLFEPLGGLVGFLAATKGHLKADTPFFVGSEDCTREFGRGGNMGALDRNALRDADLSLMVSDGPAIVADHSFTSGPIALSSFERPLVPSKMKAGVVDGFGCFPERLPPERNSSTFIPDDSQHEIGTNFLVRDRGLVVITSCSHRGV